MLVEAYYQWSNTQRGVSVRLVNNLTITDEYRVSEWLSFMTVDRSVHARELASTNKCIHQSYILNGDDCSYTKFSSKSYSRLQKLTVLYVDCSDRRGLSLNSSDH